MDRFLEAAASFLGLKHRSKKGKLGKNKPGVALNLNASVQNNLSVHKTQNEKEGKLRDKGKLFVGGLNYATTSTELSIYFSKFGDVINCIVIKCPTTGKSRGFGFVTFLNPADAEKALQTEHVLHGRTIECRPFDSKDDSKETKAKRSKEARVFLGGLPANLTEEELQQFFSRYGKVMDVHIPIDRKTKKGKGFAFISFENEDVAEKCIAERFVYLKERRVFINKADPRDARLRAEDGISESYGSTVTDQDSLSREDSASLPGEDTQSSSSGQLNFELEQHPEFHQLFQNYFLEKLTYYSGLNAKEVENRKQQLQNSEIDKLETFLRGLSVNSCRDSNQGFDSESADSDTSYDSYEEDCEDHEDHVSLLLPEIEFGESASKNSIGKSTSKATLPFEMDRPDLEFSTQEFTEDRLHKSCAPMNFKNSMGTLTCYLCEWTSPDLSFETFLSHCKTAAHKMKLMERFSESPTQRVTSKVLHLNSEIQENSQSEVNFYPEVTGSQLDDSQRQNNAQKCGKKQQTNQHLKQLPEQPSRHQPVKQEDQEVQKKKKVQKQMEWRRKKEQKQKQKVLNRVQESKTDGAPNSEIEKQTSQIDKQNPHQETTDKMNIPNLKIYALAKGMACIQPLSENKLNCEMCNKIIPISSDFDVLMRNVSQHLQSKKHLKKLLETEDKLKSSVLKGIEPAKTSSLDNKNSGEGIVKGKKIVTKKKKTKEPPTTDQRSLSVSRASLVQEKVVLDSKKPNPQAMGVKPQNAALKQEKGKTDDSRVKILCLQCNFYNSTFEEFGRHLESKRHSSTATPNRSLKTQNPEYTVCSLCNAFLFGSLYEINVHFSECLKEKR